MPPKAWGYRDRIGEGFVATSYHFDSRVHWSEIFNDQDHSKIHLHFDICPYDSQHGC